MHAKSRRWVPHLIGTLVFVGGFGGSLFLIRHDLSWLPIIAAGLICALLAVGVAAEGQDN